jgi:cytidylate kinase
VKPVIAIDGPEITSTEIYEKLIARDMHDCSRENAPLILAEDYN